MDRSPNETKSKVKRHVLVVDDHFALLEVLSETLGILGYRVTRFDRTTECLDWLRTNVPDVALLDIMMPGMDGVTLFERIRGLGHTFPIIAVTADPGIDLLRDALDIGFATILQKPIHIDALQREIEDALAGRPGS